MVLEVAILHIRKGESEDFERDFDKAGKFISASEGYIDHRLKKCIEDDHKYILLVEWESLEAHTVGFRKSPSYVQWKSLLHHYYEPFPIVEHYI